QLLRACARPIGAYWLQPRLKDVRVRTGVGVANVSLSVTGLKIALSDGSTDQMDLVVLATGYRIDISQYDIFDSSLKRHVLKTPDGYPVLDTSLQTSVNGLYMAGVIAEKTLGPTLRFVTGTSNAGPRLAASITSKRLSTN
ncbi:MAG: FAD-dependent oxidoreductase, partial [Candidatus Sulfotelmatobacter sp.]